jgi:hypothetical protein
VIESVAKSLTKNEKTLDQAPPAIENAVKARVSKPAQEIADRLLTQERKRKTRKKPAAKKRTAARKKVVRRTAAKKAVKGKAAPRRKR